MTRSSRRTLRAPIGPTTVLLLLVLLVTPVGVGAFGARHATEPRAGPSQLGLTAGSFRVAPSDPSSVNFSAWQNWPTYLGNDQRTSANLEERTLAPSNVSEVTQRWMVATTGQIGASPIVVNGTVYIGSWDGYMRAIDLATGTVEWSTALDPSSACYVNGIDSTAAYWNNSLYVGGGGDYWYALNATTGAKEWKVYVGDVTNGNFNWVSALVYRGHLYIGIASCEDAPLVWGRLLQVNLTGNHTINAAFNVVPSSQVGGSIWATPLVNEETNTVFVATGNDNYVSTDQPLTQSIIGINATTMNKTGSWQVPNVYGLDYDFGATPIQFHDAYGDTFVAGYNKNGIVYTMNESNITTNGSWGPVWATNAGGTGDQYSPLAFDGTTLYGDAANAMIGSTYYPNTVFALDPTTGQILWQKGTLGSTSYGAVTYADGMLVVEAGGVLEVLNATNGDELYSASPGGGSLTMYGSATVVDGQIIYSAGDNIYDLGLPLAAHAIAGPSGLDAGAQVNFTAFATGGLPPYTATWQFGDGTNGTGLQVHHVYAGGGTFPISFQLTDANGTVVNETLSVSVYAPFSASISATPGLVGTPPFTVQFTPDIRGGSSPVAFRWSFGDRTPNSTVASPIHVYTQPGRFTVTLAANDTTDGYATASTTVQIFDTLAISTSANRIMGEAPMAVTFAANVTGGASPQAPTWSFGDGTPSATGATLDHTYLQAGDFTATATVTDTLGAQATSSVSVSVVSPVAVLLTPTPLGANCPVGTVGYQFLASPSGGFAPFTYAWSFGDGQNGSGQAVIDHDYAPAGSVHVSVTVTDALERTANASTDVAIGTPQCPSSSNPPPPPGPGGSTPAASNDNGVLELLGIVIVAAAVVVVLLVRRPRRPAPARAEPVWARPGA